MARQARLYIPATSVHVINRGNNRTTIFLDDDDRVVFLAMFRAAAKTYKLATHAYALMGNHYHALVTPPAPLVLSFAMRTIGLRYVAYFNRKYRRCGTLWSGRYRSFVVDDVRYLLTCLRYIEQNPVRAGIVAHPEGYRWSSYRVHGNGADPDWLTPHPEYLALGSTDLERQCAYRAICGIPLDEDELAKQRFSRLANGDGAARAGTEEGRSGDGAGTQGD
jgi:putative transposase